MQEIRRHDHATEFGEDEARAILEMLRAMLVLHPDGRVTANELLESRWMVKWALPELNRQIGRV